MSHQPFSPPATINEAEWQLQEQARLGTPTAAAESDELAAYRIIDRALRLPPASALPGDFAACVARIAEQRSVVRSDAFERNLIRILVAGLGISGGVAMAVYAGDLLPAASASLLQLGDAALRWTAAALGCLGASWLCSHLLQDKRSPTSQ